MEILIPADPEKEVQAELVARYPDVGVESIPIDTKPPTSSPRPAEFIRLRAVGGPRRDITTDAFTVTLEAYATREIRARDLCAFGVALLEAAGRDGMVGAVPCGRVLVVGVPSNLPDPTIPGHFRYSATISVPLRRGAVQVP